MGLDLDAGSLLLLVNAAVFVAGFVVEGLAIMILVVPVMVPTLAALGIDPVHFGVVLVFTLMIGLMTPPMGVGLFVVSSVANIPFETLARGVLLFVVPLMVVLVLLICFPVLVTGLPNLVFGAG